MAYKTQQEDFWSGEFGVSYIERNQSDRLLNSKIVQWATMLRSASGIGSVRELGCNIGLNLVALKRLRPSLALEGYEINAEAARRARDHDVATIVEGTILDPIEQPPVDLTFTSGVLIHIDPDHLQCVYDNLVSGSRRYVLVSEYFNPSPVAIPYRGHEGKLFKRDFAGELMDRYGLKLVDYGFFYHRDHWAPQDDINWFLMER